jgi:hypothetical protein
MLLFRLSCEFGIHEKWESGWFVSRVMNCKPEKLGDFCGVRYRLTTLSTYPAFSSAERERFLVIKQLKYEAEWLLSV